MIHLFKKKTFLVIDDYPEFQLNIKQMLADLKVERIDLASNGEETLQYCRSTKYDVILCDYNLGEGKDGQQILEELRENNLINYSSLFLMLTAETTSVMVMGALEFSPDSYLAKPFTMSELKSRLEKLLDAKHALKHIYYAMDDGKFDDVQRLCQRTLKEYPKFTKKILRIESEFLYKTGKLDESQAIYQKLLKDMDADWIRLGLGKIAFDKNKLKEAENEFKTIIARNKNFLEAYDCLANTYKKLNRLLDVQKILTEAISLSPKSARRQKKLGEIALLNDDLEVASRAFRRHLKLAKNSSHDSAENIISTAKCLLLQAENSDSMNAFVIYKEISELTRSTKSVWMDDADAVTAHVMLTITSAKTVKNSELKKMIEGACFCLKNAPKKLSLEDYIRFIEFLQAQDFPTEAAFVAEKMMLYYKSAEHLDNKFQQRHKALLNNEDLMDQLSQVNDSNNAGVELYQTGQYVQALEKFAEAREQLAHSLTVHLNYLQCIVKQMETKQISEEGVKLGEKTIDFLSKLSSSNPKYARYQKLFSSFKSYKKTL
ncbi:MAG: response regulator [Pseudomonadota bacterium]